MSVLFRELDTEEAISMVGILTDDSVRDFHGWRAQIHCGRSNGDFASPDTVWRNLPTNAVTQSLVILEYSHGIEDTLASNSQKFQDVSCFFLF